MKRQSQHTLPLPDRDKENGEALEAQLMRVLQEREEQERILASIPSILITIDEQDRVTHWSPAAGKTFGIPASQAMGQPLHQCAIQWDWQPVIRGIAVCREKCVPVKLDDLHYTRPDGYEGIIGLMLSPLGDGAEANGRVLASDVYTADGKLLISAGHRVSEALLERIRNFAEVTGVREPLYVEMRQGGVVQAA